MPRTVLKIKALLTDFSQKSNFFQEMVTGFLGQMECESAPFDNYLLADSIALQAAVLDQMEQSHVRHLSEYNLTWEKIRALCLARLTGPFSLTKEHEAEIDEEIEAVRNLAPLKSSSNWCPLTFWKAYETQYPNLCRVALSLFATQATEAASERMFKGCDDIFCNERNRICDDMLHMLTFLKTNNEHLQAVSQQLTKIRELYTEHQRLNQNLPLPTNLEASDYGYDDD